MLIVGCLALAACGRQDDSVSPKKDMALYLEPNGSFSCQAPSQWRVLEKQGGAQRVTFLGPPDGPKPFAAGITVYYYQKSGSDFASPQAYAAAHRLLAGKTGPLTEKPWKGSPAWEFSATRTMPIMHRVGQTKTEKEDTVLIPAREGFYALVYSAAESVHAENAPLFRTLVESLSLK